MDEIVEKTRTKIGNTLFLLGKYPQKIFFHQPWLATDSDVIDHLIKNDIPFDKTQVEQLSKDIINVSD